MNIDNIPNKSLTAPLPHREGQGGGSGPAGGRVQYPTLTILLWFLQIFRKVKLQSLINATSGIIRVGLDFAFIWSTKQVIDVATGVTRTGGLLPHPTTLWNAGALLVSIMVLQMTLGYIGRWIAALLGVNAQNRMQRRIFEHLLRSEWHGKEQRHSGDVLNRLVSDSQTVVQVVTDTMPQMLAVLVRLACAFLFLYSMDAMLAVGVTVILPVFILLSRLYIRRMREITREVRRTDSRIQSILQESIQHRLVLKTLERVETMLKVVRKQQDILRQQVRHRTLFSSTSNLVLNIGFGSAYLFAFLWSANRLADGTITFGMMTAFIQLCGQIQGPFREMTRFIPTIISSFTAAERLMELEETPLEEDGDPIRFEGGAGIRVEHVTFAYDEHSRKILNDVSYDFPPGTATAILGETGAGKTTLIRLILALLKPDEGRVVMYQTSPGGKTAGHQRGQETECPAVFPPGGEPEVKSSCEQEARAAVSQPVGELEAGAAVSQPGGEPEARADGVPVCARTRCNLVYVPQGNSLFSGSLRWNLQLGNPEATEEEMMEALQLACADFVHTLPDGLDTIIGEDGAGLSEGQAQRIAIARALLRKGTILLLDEATSALDLHTERQLLNNLIEHNEKQASKATLLFITHRPAVVEHCSQVITINRPSPAIIN